MEENSCCLLYVVEDQLEEVERAFGAEFLAGTRVLRQRDAGVALNDQRYRQPRTPARASSLPPGSVRVWRLLSGKCHGTVADPDRACLAPHKGAEGDPGAVTG